MSTGEMGFLWISEILNSRYSGDERDTMISWVVRLLEKWFYSDNRRPFYLQPDWIPPLLDYLSHCEKTYTAGSPLYPWSIVLRILSDSGGYADFGTTLLPILTSTLSPTHPLQSRNLALRISYEFRSGWFSSQMETISSDDLGAFLRAVGDPLDSVSDILQDGEPAEAASTLATFVLIEFASSELWQNYLHRSNFTSCEDIMSTEEGKGAVLRCMLGRARPEFLCTPAEIVAAIRCLEELQCPNTTEVVITWAWITCRVRVVDWKLMEDETLRFYQTHGIRRLAALKRHITDTDLTNWFEWIFIFRYEDSPFRVRGSPRQQGTTIRRMDDWHTDLVVSQTCQLRRLYNLFGYDLTTWEEAVAVEEVDVEMEGPLEHSVTPDPFIDPLEYWACDYP